MRFAAILSDLDGVLVDSGDAVEAVWRDWAAERTSYPNHVAEAALAHAVADKVEKAYRRTDLFEKRRRLMADWAAWCARPVPLEPGRIIAMQAQR